MPRMNESSDSSVPRREPHPCDLEYQRQMAKIGVAVQIPTSRLDWELPKLLHVEGELASEALIRMRRATRL